MGSVGHVDLVISVQHEAGPVKVKWLRKDDVRFVEREFRVRVHIFLVLHQFVQIFNNFQSVHSVDFLVNIGLLFSDLLVVTNCFNQILVLGQQLLLVIESELLFVKFVLLFPDFRKGLFILDGQVFKLFFVGLLGSKQAIIQEGLKHLFCLQFSLFNFYLIRAFVRIQGQLKLGFLSFHFLELCYCRHASSGSRTCRFLGLILLLSSWLLYYFGGLFREHFVFLNAALRVLHTRSAAIYLGQFTGSQRPLVLRSHDRVTLAPPITPLRAKCFLEYICVLVGSLLPELLVL